MKNTLNHTIYQFGQFEFSVDSNTLVNRHNKNDREVKLEANVAALLVYFLQHPQRVISKSELLENVWPQTKTSANIITSTLSKLRKALTDDPFTPSYIQTVPRQGFQFIPTVEQNYDTTIPTKSKKTYRLWLLVLLAILLLIASFQWVQINFGRASIGSVKKVTSLDGIEVDPQLSPGKNWLLFRHKSPEENSVYQLNLTPWDGENTTNMAIQLTNESYQYISAVWGKTERTIYAARTERSSGLCEIVKLKLNGIKTNIEHQEKILACHKDGLTTIALHPSGILYFSDKMENQSNYTIFQLDFSSQAITRINATSDVLKGHYLSQSLKQNKLLILGESNHLKTQLIIYDVRTQKLSKIITPTDNVEAAILSPNNQEVWMSNQAGEIIAYNISDGSNRVILDTNSKSLFKLTVISKNLLLYSEAQTADNSQQADIKAIMLNEL